MGYILFSSEEELSILVTYPRWDGIIEYSYDNKKWTIWCGQEITNNKIYMRGINNTVISGWELGASWTVTGKEIKCQGNIENLLNYKSVINNIHPKMSKKCFAWMFCRCESLVEAPTLSAMYLSFRCYYRMFCRTSITKIVIKIPSASDMLIAKKVIINQKMLDDCSIQEININNKLYDINVLKLL